MIEGDQGPAVEIRSAEEEDRAWIADLVEEYWGTPVVTRGRAHRPAILPALVACRDGLHCGLLTYHIEGHACEIVTLNSVLEGEGVGTRLVEEVRGMAVEAGCTRLWVVTTNDNTDAMRFYQKRGFRISAIHIDAIEAWRRLKPGLPVIGREGIPIRDEIEMEIDLGGD